MFLQIVYSTSKIREELLFKQLCKSYKKSLKITLNSEENRQKAQRTERQKTCFLKE